MIWLQAPPWRRWVLAGLVAVFAVWIEVRPEPTIPHPFAIQPIGRGEEISAANTETRAVPTGVFEPIEIGATARREIPAGAPVLAHDVGTEDTEIPDGWWIINVEVPTTARVGDRVRMVVVDSGLVVDGFVASIGDQDSFSSGNGGVAIPGEHAAVIAGAAVNGRVAVLISTG